MMEDAKLDTDFRDCTLAAPARSLRVFGLESKCWRHEKSIFSKSPICLPCPMAHCDVCDHSQSACSLTCSFSGFFTLKANACYE